MIWEPCNNFNCTRRLPDMDTSEHAVRPLTSAVVKVPVYNLAPTANASHAWTKQTVSPKAFQIPLHNFP
jgi:hypothetical protein